MSVPQTTAGPAAPDGASVRARLAPYARPRTGRAILEIATSIVPYLALSALMYVLVGRSLALTLLLAVPTAGFLLRTYMVFHDCAHG